MTPSRARGRKVSKRMWGVMRDGDIYFAWPLRADALTECRIHRPGSKHRWSVKSLTVTYTVPTKPKPRKAK